MSSPIRKVRRKYRRYRFDNQYDSPIFIFFCDVAIGFSKLMLFVVPCLVAWFMFV